MIKLLVGLGNPGTEYEDTRHNAGFWWLDAVARELRVALAADKASQGRLARCTVEGQHRWLLQPQTYMNRSGQSVGQIARFYKIEANQILVAHDELDVVPGQVKLKFGGGHAGHNGLRDIHAQLGSGDYWRLRLGIGHPGVKDEVAAWVLRKPMAEQREAIAQAISRSIAALPLLLAGDMEKAMQGIHTTAPPRPKPPRPAQAPSATERASPAPAASAQIPPPIKPD